MSEINLMLDVVNAFLYILNTVYNAGYGENFLFIKAKDIWGIFFIAEFYSEGGK